jgi:hypothetical protein
MDHDIVIKYISAVGFPICAAVLLAYVLARVALVLSQSHVKNLEDNTEEMRKQTSVLTEIRAELPTICKADCPVQIESDNYKPRKQP